MGIATFQQVLTTFVAIVKPVLRAALTRNGSNVTVFNPEGLKEYIRSQGIVWDGTLTNEPALKVLFESLAAADTLEQSDTLSATQIAALFTSTKNIYSAITSIQSSGASPGAANLGKAIAMTSATNYLSDHHPDLFHILLLTGIITHLPDTGWTLNPSLVTNLLQDPVKIVNALGWNNPSADPMIMLLFIHQMLSFFGISSGFIPADTHDLALFEESSFVKHNAVTVTDTAIAPATTPLTATPSRDYTFAGSLQRMALTIPLFYASEGVTVGRAGVSLLPLSHHNTALQGIGIIPFAEGLQKKTYDLGDGWEGVVESTIAAGFGIDVRPATGASLKGSAVGGIAACALIRHTSTPAATTILSFDGVGSLKIGSVGVRVGVVYENDFDWSIEVPMKGCELTLDLSGGDALLKKVLPEKPITLTFDMTPAYSKKRGFHLKGGSEIKNGTRSSIGISFPINQSIGPIIVETVSLDCAVDTTGNTVELLLTCTAGAAIGPLAGSVKKFGLRLVVTFGSDGIFGIRSLVPSVKLPVGAGLGLTTALVSGGGYLEIADGEYSGLLNIAVVEMVNVVVAGIITTRLPNGQEIFAMKLFGSAKFPPIQLGFGFAISGLGFAAAIHCTMNEKALRQAVYSNTLSTILFPDDPIKNAPKIIDSLKSFFPVCEGSYIFGAMVRIMWGGAVPIIAVDAGIFVEVGNSVRIALAGIAHAELPTTQSPVLVLRFQVLGLIDFTAGTLSIDASLEGSRLLILSLSGDMALRAAWKGTPYFALSAGGFYPGYRIPACFPQLSRMALTLGNDNPTISLQAYFAVVENSVQFGARLLFYYVTEIDLWLASPKVEVSGDFSFDALISMNPLAFTAQMSAFLVVKVEDTTVASALLRIHLTGPNNYYLKAIGSAEVLGISVPLDREMRFGSVTPVLSPVQCDPRTRFKTEFSACENWRAITRNGASRAIIAGTDCSSSAPPATVEELPPIDPFQIIHFSQKAIPLTLTISEMNGAPVALGAACLTITINGKEPRYTTECFSMGHYQKMADEEKISRNAFEQVPAGFYFAATTLQPSPCCTTKPLAYETIVLRKAAAISPSLREVIPLREAIPLGGKKVVKRPVKQRTRSLPFLAGGNRYKGAFDPQGPIEQHATAEPLYTIITGTFSRASDHGEAIANMPLSSMLDKIDNGIEGTVVASVIAVLSHRRNG